MSNTKDFLTPGQIRELGPEITGFLVEFAALLDGDMTVDPADRAMVGAHFLVAEKGAPTQNQVVRAAIVKIFETEKRAVDDLRCHFEVLAENMSHALAEGWDGEEEGAESIRLMRLDLEACRMAIFQGLRTKDGAVFGRVAALMSDTSSALRELDAELKQKGLLLPELE